MIKKLQLCLLVVLILLKIKFGHAQIIFPIIGMSMSARTFKKPLVKNVQSALNMNHL